MATRRLGRDSGGKFLSLKKKSNRGAHLKKSTIQFTDHDYFQTADNNDIDLIHVEDIGSEVEVDVNVGKDESEEWREGRRMVELGHLAEQMFCHICKMPLHLVDTVRESRYGLGSVLHIRCKNSSCNAVCPVETGKRGTTGAFDINSKAVLGKIF